MHRDLKPENVVGQQIGSDVLTVKILDFGLAKLHTADSAPSGTLTVHGSVMGTLGYMSPEQLMGGKVDQRTDIFAVGVMLVEALTGRMPFRGDTTADLVRAVLHDVVRLQPVNPQVMAIDALLQQCLAKDARQRIGSVELLRGLLIPALDAFQHSVHISVTHDQ